MIDILFSAVRRRRIEAAPTKSTKYAKANPDPPHVCATGYFVTSLLRVARKIKRALPELLYILIFWANDKIYADDRAPVFLLKMVVFDKRMDGRW